ncbi:MAG: FabA/FabZ family ACP-dehydratase [Salinimicrobium sp.]
MAKNISEIDTSLILQQLPYDKPFLFVDELQEVSAEGITGSYTFPEDSFFYKGHFKDQPVTPGVILTECMAQIGLVCLGIYLLKNDILEGLQVALTKTDVDFYLPVFPGEKVKVISEKIYFRFGKLKCTVKMENSRGKLVCKGEISGMMKSYE